MRTIALVDNDFIQKLAEIRHLSQEMKERMINQVMESIGVQGRMHELLYRNEFQDMNNASLLFQHEIFSVLSLEEMFSGDRDKETYYCLLIPELYKKMTGEELSLQNVLKEWKSRSSLGEVHSLAACMVCGYSLFLSDDRGSKMLMNIIKRDYSKEIRVHNRREVIEMLKPGTIPKADRNAFKHV